MPEHKPPPRVGQTREDRIWKAYRAAQDAYDYRRGGTPAIEVVARRFCMPVRHVRDIVEDRKRENAKQEAERGNTAGSGKGPGECMHTGWPRKHRGDDLEW
jgi:hypothetical protein